MPSSKAGIDYEGSMRTGLQEGMSTLESSMALAKKYIETTDPKRAAKMAAATAQISKESNPEKAKAMMARWSRHCALATCSLTCKSRPRSPPTCKTRSCTAS